MDAGFEFESRGVMENLVLSLWGSLSPLPVTVLRVFDSVCRTSH